jgi:hypothetical protein
LRASKVKELGNDDDQGLRTNARARPFVCPTTWAKDITNQVNPVNNRGGIRRLNGRERRPELGYADSMIRGAASRPLKWDTADLSALSDAGRCSASTRSQAKRCTDERLSPPGAKLQQGCLRYNARLLNKPSLQTNVGTAYG